MSRLTLRTRLIAGMGLVAVVLLVVVLAITAITRDRLISQVDSRLEAFSPAGRAPFPDDGAADGGPLNPPDGAPDWWQERVSDVYEGFVDGDGVLRTRFEPNVGDADYGAPDLSGVELPDNGSRLVTVGSDTGTVTYRALIQATQTGDGRVTVTAVPLDAVQQTITRLLWVQAGGVLVTLAVLGLVAWWVLHLGIRPVKEMTRTATRIADGDLAVRVPETAPGTESGDLAVALNTMLARIGAALDERAASEERLRRFVADASHELRTPVTTIRGYAELYRHGGLAAGPELDDAMRRTEQEAARMGRLVGDMLTLAKLDEERPLVTQPVDLVTLARDAVTDARVVALDRMIDLELSAETAIVIGDEDRLRQVIGNVLGNALVHTDAGVRIEVRVTAANGSATLEVTDEGAGMDPEVAARVTERFFRADPARSRHRGGSGLGLSIVDAAVAAHDGSLAIDSEPGRGTAVRLTLPLA
jgi:two-component system OmpR family sensor kinase